MIKSNGHKNGESRFMFHLAEDAIMHWLDDKPHMIAYFQDLEERVEELAEYQNDPRVEDWLDEAETVANMITDEVRKATGDTFSGTAYSALEAAARDRLNINW